MYKVAVLIPTYNSILWIEEMINSVLDQNKVLVELFVSDDGSSDGTEEFILSLSEAEERINIIGTHVKSGSAGAHFFHMISLVSLEGFDYVSFCDHDDIWMPDKLISAIKCLKDKSSDGYSSDVYTFFNDKNKTSYYKYSYAQRKYDYFFQTAGPGCTYVFTRDLYLSFFDLIKKNDMSKIYAHDWMIYHHARRNGYSWFIDPSAHILYRQHENNEIGVNKGLLANMQRMKKVRSGWYREQILNMSSLYGDDSTLINRLRRFNIMDRILLSISVLQYRRSSYQAASLAIMILFIMK